MDSDETDSDFERQPKRKKPPLRPPRTSKRTKNPRKEDEIVPETPPESQDALSATKRARQDIADRREKNETFDSFVIKKTLKQFCKPEAQGLEWDECLTAVNQAIAEAYLLANFYVLRQLKAKRALCKIDHTFYQTCLSITTNKDRTKLSLRQRYDEYVLKQARKDANQRWKETGRIGKMKDAPLLIPEFSETDFTAWAKAKDIDLEDAGYEFMQLRGDHPLANTEHLNQGWFQAAAKQMATNAQNGIVRNFAKRLRSFVLDVFDLSKKEAHEVLNGVFAETYEGTDPVVLGLRGQIPRTSENKVSWDAHDLLPIFYEFLTHIEKSNEINKDKKDYKEMRTFSLLPTKKGFEANHCKVDSTGLRALLLRSPRMDPSLAVTYKNEKWTLSASIHSNNASNWIDMADLWWHRLFYVSKLENEEKRSFHREITTDGYGVSAHMSRPTRGKKKSKKSKKKNEGVKDNTTDVLGPTVFKTPKGRTKDYDVIWGIDPGRTDFITATNPHGNTVRFRTSVYRSASGFYRCNRQSNREIDKVPRIRQLLRTTPTKKTTCLDTLIEHIRFTFKHVRELLSFFLRPIFRRLKFRRFSLKTSQLDRACNELVGPAGTRTIIGFGDCGAAGNSVIKSSPAGPVKMLARKLARQCELVAVDEHRTSRAHHDCDAEEDLCNQWTKRECHDGVVRNVKVHKVLHCLTLKGGCGKTVDRDANAAKNILSILMHQLAGDQERPERLRRRPRAS